jgi:uncharacterized protein (UPF0548 family)
MTGPALFDEEAERLRTAPFTYDEVGSTRSGSTPRGYGTLHRSAQIGFGAERFAHAAQAVMGWEMHRRAGLSVRSTNEQVVEGAVAVVRLGIGPLGLNAPVRVVYVVDQPHLRGFAYGTLPGHPECGEEAFMVELHDGGAVTLNITAFSRPASLLARLGGPLARAVQSRVTDRYLLGV